MSLSSKILHTLEKPLLRGRPYIKDRFLDLSLSPPTPTLPIPISDSNMLLREGHLNSGEDVEKKN